eukprot:4459504-Amphidinium_carterae.1
MLEYLSQDQQIPLPAGMIHIGEISEKQATKMKERQRIPEAVRTSAIAHLLKIPLLNGQVISLCVQIDCVLMFGVSRV